MLRNIEVRPFEAHPLLRPRADNHLKRLIKDLARPGLIDSEAAIFDRLETSPDTEFKPAIAHKIDQCAFLGDTNRVIERQHDDAAAQSNPLRDRRNSRLGHVRRNAVFRISSQSLLTRTIARASTFNRYPGARIYLQAAILRLTPPIVSIAP